MNSLRSGWSRFAGMSTRGPPVDHRNSGRGAPVKRRRTVSLARWHRSLPVDADGTLWSEDLPAGHCDAFRNHTAGQD